MFWLFLYHLHFEAFRRRSTRQLSFNVVITILKFIIDGIVLISYNKNNGMKSLKIALFDIYQ